MIGEVTTYAIHADGTRETVEEGRNLVVNNAYVVMAMSMKQDPAFGGFLYWAVGDGNTTDSAAWDAGVADGTRAPALTNASLNREFFRKALSAADITFLDATGNVTASPTNRLQITVTFNETEGNGFMREWGIFGGNATATAGSGFLINRKVHPTYEKTDAVKLERVLRFTF